MPLINKPKPRTIYSEFSKVKRTEVIRKLNGDDPRPVWLVITSPNHRDTSPGDRYD